MVNPPNADQAFKHPQRNDPNFHRLQTYIPIACYSIGGSGTIAVYSMGDDGEVEGSYQVLTISAETGILGMPGFVAPLDTVKNTDPTLVSTTFGPAQCLWMEIIPLTGLITWGLYGLKSDFHNDGLFLKTGTHRTYPLSIGESLRLGPYPEDQLSTSGAVAVDTPPLTPSPIAPGVKPWTDRSGTITAGGVAQNAMAANTTRGRLLIVNPFAAGESLWIDPTGTAAVIASPSIELRPGDAYMEEGTTVTGQAISVIAATLGHIFTAKEA